MNGAIAAVAAFLLGSIPFGLLVVRLMTGSDVRQSGSGNIGATNVLRTAGRSAGLITLVLDIAKGSLAVWLAAWLTNGNLLWMSIAAIAVMLGHAFSPWLNFKGGKAVACFVGAFACLTPSPLLAVVLLFILILLTTRYLSLGSIVAAGLFPVACWMILHPSWPVMVAAITAAVLVVWRHSGNIERIRDGTEHVFRFSR